MSNVLITRAEAALRLSVSPQTIDRMIRGGRLVAVKLGTRRVGITQSSVDAIIQAPNQKGN
jgi:excisionase family DNA binding protein